MIGDALHPRFVGIDDAVAVDVDVGRARGARLRVTEADDDLGARLRADGEVQHVVVERCGEEEGCRRAPVGTVTCGTRANALFVEAFFVPGRLSQGTQAFPEVGGLTIGVSYQLATPVS